MQDCQRFGMLYRYTDIFVGQPQVEEDYITSSITPQQCRLRDMTYAAPITVDVEYTRGKEIVVRKGKDGVGAVYIGRIPLMLRCDRSAGRSLPFALVALASKAAPTLDADCLRDFLDKKHVSECPIKSKVWSLKGDVCTISTSGWSLLRPGDYLRYLCIPLQVCAHEQVRG